ncbi:MAG TPA: hypothetical protein VLU99_04785 [Nitrososphaerales archaeon]|nr:hypothetical protein [Nitrososphaerales archaeon]
MAQELQLRLVAGFVVVISTTALLNKAGDLLYHKGIAKPFYLFGHRLHHRNFLLALVPAVYVAVAAMVYLHYMRILWYSFWPSVEITLFLAGVCLTIDLTLDALSSADKRRALLHHEWVYLLVPAYAFTHLLALV